jgi:hypothetical protein
MLTMVMMKELSLIPDASKNHFPLLVGPADKRTEGRAPVWGSEFHTKVALQGGIQQKSLMG